MRIIEFKYLTGEFGVFSNFYKKIIIVDGIKFRTGEHLYQYKKINFLQSIGEPISDEFIQAIIAAKTPKEAKRLGRTRFNQVEKWDDMKVDAMMDVLREKFKYGRFKEKLLDTGDALIVESSYHDRFWGKNGSNGLNMLGKCLMRIREELQE